MFTIAKDATIDPKTVKDAIDGHASKVVALQRLHDYYKGDHDILSRSKEGSKLKNNKVVTNHARYITKINVGYLLGNPIDYRTKNGIKADLTPVTNEYEKQTIQNIDTEIGTLTSKYGTGGEYIFASGNEPKSRAIDPRHYVVIVDDTMEHKKVGVVVYGERKAIDGQAASAKYTNVMLILPDKIQYFDESITKVSKEEKHSFGVIPFIDYKNNADLEGDYEQVISLINAYNLLMSDRVNDKEQWVEAILVIYGFKLTKDQQEAIREYGILGVPDADSKAEYISKEMQEEAIEVLRKALREDIHKISMTPDLSDENFAGNDSGVAIKYKLIAFELNTSTKESYFELGLQERFLIYNNYLTKLKKGVTKIEPYQVDAIFKRKLPQNDFEASQMISNLKGLVSDKTLVSQISFVDDVDAEIKEAQADALKRAQMMADQFGTDQPLGGTGNTKPGDKKPADQNTDKK